MKCTTMTSLRLALLGLLVVAATASAGTYIVDGTCSAWTPFNNQPDRLAAYPECGHLRARNVLGNFSTSRNQAGAGWKFDVPPGTGVQAVDLNAYITGGKSWFSDIRVIGSAAQGGTYGVMASCYGQDQCGKGAGLGTFPGLAGAVVARVYCADDTCPNSGSKPRASIDIARSAITLFDPSPPSVSIAGGSVTGGGWQGGGRNLAVAASDNTGIRAVRGLIDGDARFSNTSSLPCDYSHGVPCSNQSSAGVDLDLRGLPDGQHSLEAQAEDASGNAANSAAQVINVDNTPPLAPTGARLTGGLGWRASNNFTVAWSNPGQAYAPIAAAAYRLCPQGAPDTSAACVSQTLAAPDISRLAFKVPGPGAWRIRLWLVDAAGNGVAENGVTVGGIGLLAGGKGSKRSYLKVGRRSHGHLKRTTTVPLGRRVKVVGRLSAGGRRKGIRRTLLVYRRTSVQGARYRPAGRVRTSKRGRFVFRAHRGPSRRLLFVYPGGKGVAGRIATVDVHVRAKLGIKPDRRQLRNGEAVKLSGRLRGGKIPPGGALLELRVFTRGSWRPFATPRTDDKGRWSYDYRFETVTGTAKFRFRAALRKQPTYPYTARSKAIGITVRGL